MRIAIVNWSSRKTGGAETYIDRVIGGLSCAGHETALFCETDLPADRTPITLPLEAPLWCVSNMGLERAISCLRGWCPDVIYGQGLLDPEIEARTLEVAPAVLFAHNYYGTCISGAKTFKFPVVRPCARRFGWQCLMHYYPHRCGGLNPLTMWSSFRRESRRLQVLRSYQAIVTASEHMRCEYLRHSFNADAVKTFRLPIGPGSKVDRSCLNAGHDPRSSPMGPVATNNLLRLLFVGRMDPLKGGGVLLDALPGVLSAIDRSLLVTFVGDGPERGKWEAKASDMASREPRLRIHFTGWLEAAHLECLMAQSDLLVVPSLWPEPFGMVGPQAGLHGLPVAGFAVGGIPEWLIDGVNGHLAPGDPPTAQGLSSAIIKSLHDPEQHNNLRAGAADLARRMDLTSHIKRLMELFNAIANVVEAPGAARSDAVTDGAAC